MNYKFLILLIAGSFLVSGCYTQLETIERERPSRAYTPQQNVTSAYDTYYSEDEYLAYEEGYYDGVFDAHLGFRSYNHRRSTATLGFHWGRPFFGYGFSYGYYYDPFWHHAQLYDPFYFSYYGFYGARFHNRFRHFGHFHSPFWGGWGNSYFIVYGNYYNVGGSFTGGGSSPIVRGPRSSGVHRGTITNTRDNRVATRGVASRDDRSRVRGDGTLPAGYVNAANTRVRTSQTPVVNRGEARTAQRATPNRSTVDRRRAAPPPQQRAQPNRTRNTNNAGTVNRTRGNTNNSSGTVNRTRGNSSNNSGNVNRSRGSNNSSGNVNRSRGGSNTQAAPARSRSSNNSGNRSRNRNDD
ncbi:MAG: hypothetical protein LAT84_02785 [Balneolia bacterium]|nr:hypothetical protein [Balneolia bacterium]